MKLTHQKKGTCECGYEGGLFSRDGRSKEILRCRNCWKKINERNRIPFSGIIRGLEGQLPESSVSTMSREEKLEEVASIPTIRSRMGLLTALALCGEVHRRIK